MPVGYLFFHSWVNDQALIDIVLFARKVFDVNFPQHHPSGSFIDIE